MQRQPNKVKHDAVVSIGQNGRRVIHLLFQLIGSAFGPSQTGEEHTPPETAVEASDGTSVAHSITAETTGYAPPSADEFSQETAKPAAEFSGVIEAQVIAPTAYVYERLISQPTPRRTNPTTVIYPEINMEYAIEHQDTVLYEKQRGHWVAEPLPEKPVEKVAPTVPTYPNNSVLDFKRIAAHA